ncbi:MAG: DUF742 domain-containing protein [Streptosporangiales bacterium]|nr:DUF742 domain-containing protein [Streptosporangiales bacterium]
MTPPEDRWLDEAAGPLVRPYAMTGGRTRSKRTDLDMIAIIVTAENISVDTRRLGPEHRFIVDACRQPLSVAEIASDLDIPLGVVRILLGDLLEQGLITVGRPAPVSQLPSERVLKEVINGLQAL